MADRPTIQLLPGADRRAATGHPWIYSNEIRMDTALKALEPGTIAVAERADGRALGTGFFNPRSLIAFRFLARDARKSIDDAFICRRLERALRLRDRLMREPYYRLCHAEADGIPGCVIDRFGDLVVIEPNSAGADRMIEMIIAAVDRLMAPATIIVSAEGAARRLEGLDPVFRIVKGNVGETTEIVENGAKFLVDFSEGQKTGWFFDQRDNRALMANLARGADVLDLYCYLGGFGIEALRNGAKSVVAVDRSERALDLAGRSVSLNQASERFRSMRSEVFSYLERAEGSHESFDIVIADPPAFVKSKKDLAQGMRAYRKLSRLACARVRNGGLLFIASCSYNMPVEEFRRQVAKGLHDAGRSGRILYSLGAAPDHPTPPMLPETAYLKALVLEID